MPFIEQFAQQAAGNVANAGMGLLFQGLANQQNFRQAQRMQNLQIKGSKELTDYNRRSQYQQWLDTNFPAQVAQAEAAGLNPGLLYAGTGGGGATTGSAGGAMPSGGTQQSASPIGMQVLTTAQLKLLEAQTNKTNAEAEQIRGVDTELKTGQLELTKIETQLKTISSRIAGSTEKEQIDKIVAESLQATEALDKIARENVVDKATMNARIDKVQAEYMGTLIHNTLMKAQTKLTLTQEQSVEVAMQLMRSQKTINEHELTRIAADIYLKKQQAHAASTSANRMVDQTGIERERNELMQERNFQEWGKMLTAPVNKMMERRGDKNTFIENQNIIPNP